MSRAISIAGVRPLGWLARVRAQRSSSARACPAAQSLGAGAAGLAPRARGTALGMGARDDRTRLRSGPRPTVVQTDTFARARLQSPLSVRPECPEEKRNKKFDRTQ